MPPSRSIKISITVALFLFLAVSASAKKNRGRELIDASGCKGCHRLNGTGGNVGPALDGVGRRLTLEQLRQALVAPRAGRKNTAMMPSFGHLPKSDLQALTKYLKTLK